MQENGEKAEETRGEEEKKKLGLRAKRKLERCWTSPSMVMMTSVINTVRETAFEERRMSSSLPRMISRAGNAHAGSMASWTAPEDHVRILRGELCRAHDDDDDDDDEEVYAGSEMDVHGEARPAGEYQHALSSLLRVADVNASGHPCVDGFHLSRTMSAPLVSRGAGLAHAAEEEEEEDDDDDDYAEDNDGPRRRNMGMCDHSRRRKCLDVMAANASQQSVGESSAFVSHFGHRVGRMKNGSGVPGVSPETAMDIIKMKQDAFNVFVIDCRYPFEYNGGHIASAGRCMTYGRYLLLNAARVNIYIYVCVCVCGGV